MLIKQFAASTEVAFKHSLELSLFSEQPNFIVSSKAELSAAFPLDFNATDLVCCGFNDFWDINSFGNDGTRSTAIKLMAGIAACNEQVSTTNIYPGADSKSMLEGLLGREGIPPEQIVYMGEHALVVSYVDDPNGFGMLTAYLQIFKLCENGVKKEKNGDIAMYKAEVHVSEQQLEIRADYGKDDPVIIQIDDRAKLQRFVELAHRKDLFALTVFNCGLAVS